MSDELRDELKQHVKSLGQGSHACLVYETRGEQLGAVVAYLTEGLARGERCLYIADEHTVEEVSAALGATGVDVAGARERGALLILTKRETYLRDGVFDPPRMLAFLQASTAEALAAGYAGLRATGEMTWALGPEAGCERLIEYEALVNELLPGSAALAICQYNRRRFPPEIIRDALRTHPLAILDDLVCPNPYYEHPAMILGQRPVSEKVDWMIGQLRRARQAELARAQLVGERAARAVAERTLRLHNELMAVISHDLRNPLTTIKWQAQLLRRQLDRTQAVAADAVVEGLTRIEETATAVAGAIGEILDVTRVDLDHPIELHRAPVDLVELARRVGDRQQRTSEGHLVRVEASVPSLVGDYDPVRLERVLVNLIANAIKYSPDGGEVRVAVGREPGGDPARGWAVVSVADQGMGIPAADLAQVFERFKRGSNVAERTTGAGLGLASVKLIVGRHGGSVDVASVEGSGTTFTVRLPLRDAGGQERLAELDQPEAQSALHRAERKA